MGTKIRSRSYVCHMENGIPHIITISWVPYMISKASNIPQVNLCILPFLSWILKANVLGGADRQESARPVSVPPSEANFKEPSLRLQKCVSTYQWPREINTIIIKTLQLHANNLRASSSSSLEVKAMAESQNFCIILFVASVLMPAVPPTQLVNKNGKTILSSTTLSFSRSPIREGVGGEELYASSK